MSSTDNLPDSLPPVEAALELADEFLETVLAEDGGTLMDTVPLAQLESFVDRALALGLTDELTDPGESDTPAALANCLMRVITEWSADERDRRAEKGVAA